MFVRANEKELDMRTFITYLVLIMTVTSSSFICFSCVNDDDYSTPVFIETEPDVKVNFSIIELLDFISDKPVLIESDEPLYIEGFVISDDESGNFFKNLVIQDKLENPEAGISISTHATNLYIRYELGRKVYFRIDGLYIGSFRGLPSIGVDGDEINRMSAEEFNSRIERSLNIGKLKPKELAISELSDIHLNTLIQLNNLEFNADHIGQTYGNLDNNFGADRILNDCLNNSIVLRNNAYADFNSEFIPDGNGSLISVLSKFLTNYQLVIRDIKDVNFYTDRCEFDNRPGKTGGMPFIEDFNNLSLGDFSLNNWYNQNINDGNTRFYVTEFAGNKYVQISAYSTKEDPFEVWLISPGIHLDRNWPHLSFDTKDAHWTGEVLRVYISTNFEDNISEANWIDITDQANIAKGHSNWPNEFTNSGYIDLSSYKNHTIHVAFRYLGEDFGRTTTYQIDNISIRSIRH